MNKERGTDNKIIYQLNLTNTSLGLISPSLFVERLREEIINKLPFIKTDIIYNTKDKRESLIQLQCFSSKSVPDYQANNLKEEISLIASTLRDELISRINDARRSIV